MRSTRIQNTLIFACLCFVGVLTLGCQPAGRDTAPHSNGLPDWETLLTDDLGVLTKEVWEIHTVRGAKVGHRRTRVFDCESDLQKRQRIEAIDLLEIKRFGTVIEQQLKTVSWESQDGKLLGFAYELRDDGTGISAGGFVDGERLLLQITQPHEADARKELRWSTQNGGPFAIERSLRTQPMTAGETRVVEAFVPVLDRLVRWELMANGQESVEVDGEVRELLKIRATDSLSKSWQLPMLLWVDANGEILKTHEGLLDRMTIRATQEEAMELNDLARLDVGLAVGVSLANPFPDPHESTEATYRVQLDGIDPLDVFAAGASQRLAAIADDPKSAVVTVKRITPLTMLSVDAKPVSPTAEDIRPNSLIQSEDRRVRAIADAVAGSIEDPFQAAVALEQYLFRQLAKKDFRHVFASAAEVARSREGDCSEHAVLLAATCRARGIPARVILGLMYSVPDKRFLYHMWNEVWIQDRWIPLDATLGRGGIGAAHLKLRESNLARESAYELVAPVLFLSDRLEIELVDRRPAR